MSSHQVGHLATLGDLTVPSKAFWVIKNLSNPVSRSNIVGGGEVAVVSLLIAEQCYLLVPQPPDLAGTVKGIWLKSHVQVPG